ncbi:O-antigen ligase family protein [Opitutus sp. ER46]|uniref:O-antigen ligase family protein n=1 Tax=Opitutus sp. ER46 TaxID=2161864 RepID=UPI000D30BA8C|nr:O-antigen ligase family protein [Opitutus sp. ER46]PTX95560.1 hypothetical protein DB354_09055 [Opitutus sp. ER46]
MIPADGLGPSSRSPEPGRPPPDAGAQGPRLPVVGLAVAALVGLAVISIVPPAATRVFSWPWSLAYAVTLLAPVGILLLRAFAPRHPLVSPRGALGGVALAFAAAVLVSAIASPHRGPALLWAAPWFAATAAFFALFDWLHATPGDEARRRTLTERVFLGMGLLLGVASLLPWLVEVGARTSFAEIVAARNPYPLGHSNYTAGLALLLLPWGVHGARRPARGDRWAGLTVAVMALVMLLSSGSRAGVLALGAMAVAALGLAPWSRRAKARVAAAGLLAGLLFVAANPRTRAMLSPSAADAAPNISNVQRAAMLHAGLRMGMDRPILGWGPGTTPLVYPRYRAQLEGGAESVLQLHSLPLQLWAEFGGVGLALAVLGAVLVLAGARRHPTAAVALGGYAVFSLFDAQLDVPVFGIAVAASAALLRPPPASAPGRRLARGPGVLALLGLLALVTLGRSDRAPALNVAALSDEVGRREPARARALLEQSLALNPDQEIAHFNLGWLLVVDDPGRAARHFTAAAHLVPDKGGVYFGLGLARLNAGRADAAAAFALEWLNDPVFQLSPWWRNERLLALRPAVLSQLAQTEDRLAARLRPDSWPARELRYLQRLRAWLAGEADAAAVAAVANTAARREFFRGAPSRETVTRIPPHSLRRQRVGYPVLMRNLDLPPPFDLWVVTESSVRETELAFLWPDKGWVPSPLLIELLDRAESGSK